MKRCGWIMAALALPSIPAQSAPVAKSPDMTAIRAQFAAKDAEISRLKAIIVRLRGASTAAAPSAELKRLVQDYNALLAQAQSDAADSDVELKMSSDYSTMSSQAATVGDLQNDQDYFQKSMDFMDQATAFLSALNDHMTQALSIYNKIKASPDFDRFYFETGRAVDAAHTTPSMKAAKPDGVRFIQAR